MRFYKVWYPGCTEYGFATRLKGLKDLPEGTTIQAIAADRDGHETDAWDIPVVNGKPHARGRTLYGKGTIRQYGPRKGTVRA